MPRAGDEPNRQNTGQTESADSFHPKIHPNDEQFTLLKQVWAQLDSLSRRDLIEAALSLRQKN